MREPGARGGGRRRLLPAAVPGEPLPLRGPRRPERGRSAPLCSAARLGQTASGSVHAPGLRRGAGARLAAARSSSIAAVARGRSAFCCWVRLATVGSLLMFSSQSRRTCKLGVAAAASALRPFLLAALGAAKELSPFHSQLSLGGGFTSACFAFTVRKSTISGPPVYPYPHISWVLSC